MENTIRGGKGSNSLFGSNGDDVILDPTGNDWIDGGTGSDSISAGDGNDRVFGGVGNDHVFGDEGNDYLYGDLGRGKPRILAATILGADNDKLYGGSGDDVLFAGDGRDSLTGGAGQDTFVFQFHNPAPGVDQNYGPNADHTTIVDFDPAQDIFTFSGEAAGDIIAYFNYQTMTAELGYVTSENQVDDFAHLGNVQSLLHLAGLGLTASDFMFC
ncbi:MULTISPECIES: calcium-binding protein [Sinorhizobium]|uniref:Hemolysin expression modulating protein n=1 Tax=Sinorhizobium americanum TaxID=194963 RepID=A0A2S3YR50_9HYPH|nr:MULTISPECIES: calcium-binding protein [Sinorhizobium]PDT35837.1 hemolysin expression modulating protein [Sinorhizobium sp. FG01]PDT50680.1 hemolysin expression modulating protein [Sinorhizobium sp. NG07B]POH33961.1 hemolysin expression modulating protein [Sinorhizobium americanum]POH33990.1 hemolysin expression modulating protein [Sinorhizobium americanum]